MDRVLLLLSPLCGPEILGDVSLFLETIKEALHAIKHASMHTFLLALRGGHRSHSAVNLCSQSL